MKPETLLATGCLNHHSRLSLSDGSALSGVPSFFFPEEPGQLYLIRSGDLIKAQPLSESNDLSALRPFCVRVDLELVEQAELI
ncbi:MAG: hypothetical protein IPN85_03270 [Flavobacteriales bacterium]|nr:hypothetical protein [Flavobacteriales bacterium]MBL0036305.1 hypothetical protein [Flavobacteriales bacterium]